MPVRVISIGNIGELASAVEGYGLKPGQGPEDARYYILLVGPGGAGSWLPGDAKGILIVALAGSGALDTVLSIAGAARSSGVRYEVMIVDSSGRPVEEWMLYSLQGIRAAGFVDDVSLLLYGYDEDEASSLDLGLDVAGYYTRDDALSTVREAMEYGGLYIGSYLAEYYDVEGLDEDGLSRSLGVYLALRSVLEASGANAILLNCSLLEGEGIEPWLAIHLLLDEGVPVACGDGDRHAIASISLSMALTGKPPIIGVGKDHSSDGVVIEPTVVPTLVASERILKPANGYYTPANKPRPGVYTLLSPGTLVREVELIDGDRVVVRGVRAWELASPYIYLIPGRVLKPLGKAIEYLGSTL